jgi:hypothetical protein
VAKGKATTAAAAATARRRVRGEWKERVEYIVRLCFALWAMSLILMDEFGFFKPNRHIAGVDIAQSAHDFVAVIA